MAKFGITTIPALVLLDEHGQVICTEGRGWCDADPQGLAFPWQDQARVGPVAQVVVNFDLLPAKPSQQSASPARIRQANLPRSKILAAKQDLASVVHPAGEPGRKVERQVGCPMPPARARTTAAPDMDPPPSFLSIRAGETGERADALRWANGRPQNSSGLFGATALPSARGVANVHARASNQWAKQKHDPPDIVVAELPPDKPNLRFALETIPQGELTSLMQPQPLAEVHPFAPTLQKWQQGIPVNCGPDLARSGIDAAVECGPHPTACTPDLIALFAKDIKYQIKAGFCRIFL